MADRWIVIPNWDGPTGFQHYKDRTPRWIKNYTELMSDDAYLSLTLHQRGVLHGLWLEYAAARRQIPDSTLVITRRLGERVTRTTLDALNEAGFIRFSASRPLAQPEQNASPEKSREEKELRAVTSQETHTAPADEQPPDIEVTTIRATVAASLKQAQEAAAKEHAA